MVDPKNPCLYCLVTLLVSVDGSFSPRGTSEKKTHCRAVDMHTFMNNNSMDLFPLYTFSYALSLSLSTFHSRTLALEDSKFHQCHLLTRSSPTFQVQPPGEFIAFVPVSAGVDMLQQRSDQDWRAGARRRMYTLWVLRRTLQRWRRDMRRVSC